MKYYYTIFKSLVLTATLISINQKEVLGQELNSSPYTRYGIGAIEEPITTPFFGNGLTTAQSSFFTLNITNPASYSSLTKYNPVFNVDINSTNSKFSTESNSSRKNVSGLKTFAIGLPVGKRTGVAFGVTPYSTMGYDITSTDSLDGDLISYKYHGAGSVNNAFIGIGYNLINKGDTSKLSIGINSHYLFGTLVRQRDVIFDNTSYLNSKAYERERVSGVSFDAGIQYYQKINDKSSFRYGATFGFGSNLNFKQDFYAYNFSYYYSSIESPQDTVSYYENKPGTYKLPRKFSTGVAYQFNKKWTIGVQYGIENWNQMEKTVDSIGVPLNELVQKTKLTVGIEYEPTTEKGDKNKNIFQKSTYRLGIYTGNYGLMIDSTILKNYGISFGTTIPLISSSSLSSLNFGFAYGKMGTTENGLIQENYFTFRVGLALMPNMRFDRWFMKRKYN